MSVIENKYAIYENGVLRIKDGITEINSRIWEWINYIRYGDCTLNVEVIIPKSVNKVLKNTFYHAHCIKEITIPESVKELGEYAFYGCYNLQHITLPQKLSYISNSCFGECVDLQEIILPEEIKSIEDFAFGHCEKIKEITIPLSVKEIGQDAFCRCDSIEEIFIPKHLLGEDDDKNTALLEKWGLEGIGARLTTYEKHPTLPVDEITKKSKEIKRFDGVIRKNPIKRKT